MHRDLEPAPQRGAIDRRDRWKREGGDHAEDALAEHPAAHIVIRSSLRDNGRIRLSVRDNGPGFPGDMLSRAFEPYFTTKARGRGTGLGLFITRKIIEDHHGRIEISSRPGEGTTVEIRLPLMA